MPTKKKKTEAPKSAAEGHAIEADVAGATMRNLKKPQTIVKQIKTIRPRTVCVDKGALGIYAYAMGHNTPMESIAAILAHPAAMEVAAEILLAPGLTQNVLSALFPGKDQRFRAGNHLMNHYTIASAIRKTIPSTTSMLGTEGVVEMIASIMARALSQFKVVLPAIPAVTLQRRDMLYPNRETLIHAIRTQAITDILENIDVDLKVKSTKDFYSTAAVAANLEPLIQTIGRALLEVPRFDRYVNDSLQIVRAFAASDTTYVDYPAELKGNADVTEMLENFTILKAAVSMDPAPIATPVHKLEYALHYTNTAIKGSKRFDVRPIELCGTLYDHIHVTDRSGIRRGVFVHGNIRGEARTQVSHFMPTETTGGLFSQAPMTDAEDVFNAMTASFFDEVSPSRVCSACATLLDSVAERIETPVLVSTMVSDLGLAHYAACLSDALQIGVNDKNQLDLQYTLAVDEVHVPPTVLHYGRLIATTDPGYVALMAEPIPSNELIPTHVQTIPDDSRKMYLATNPKQIAKPLGQQVEMNLRFGQKIFKIATTLGKLINLTINDNVYVTTPMVNRTIVTEAIAVYRDVIDMVETCHEQTSKKDPMKAEFDLSLFKTQAAISLADLFRPTFTSLSAVALSHSIHNLVLQTTEAKDGIDELRTRMQHKQSRLEGQIWASLLVLNKAAWLPYSDIQWILDTFKDANAYPVLAPSFNL